MSLTTCFVCAKALDDRALNCESCETRYCDENCENEHRAHAQVCAARASQP